MGQNLNLTRLMVKLDGTERSALFELARSERRDLRAQAAVVIREALIAKGLLEPAEDLQEKGSEVAR